MWGRHLDTAVESAAVLEDLARLVLRRRDSPENASADKDTLRLYTGQPFQQLYIGVTNDLARRIYEHKQELVPGFTSRYKIRHLIYVEEFVRADRSYCQEKQLKGWTRKRKLALAESANPTMRDLSAPSLRD